MALPNTLSKQVSVEAKKELSYRVLHQMADMRNSQTNETIRVPFNDILRKYRFLLDKIIVSIDYSNADQMYNLIRYNPKALSYRLYGTTEYWAELLLINNCGSVIDFNKRIVKAYDPQLLKKYVNEIMILEGLLK